MKKLIIAVGLCVAAFSASAQNFQAQSLLGVESVIVTNTFAITNAKAWNYWGTNQVGTTYTNSGTRIVAAAGNFVNLLGEASLWSDKNGRPFGTDYAVTITNAQAAIAAYPLLSSQMTPWNISVKMTSQSGANAAVQFYVAAIPDGVNEDTVGTTWFTFAFTPTASSTQTFVTNCPSWLWQGSGMIRLKYIINTDVDATSNVAVTDVFLNGFRP